MEKRSEFISGLKDGLPICLGYISVSFAFGMLARQSGMPIWTAVLMSMSNVTSAGQFAGLTLILNQGTYLELAMTTLIINLRYSLMSLSLTQKSVSISVPGNGLPYRLVSLMNYLRSACSAGRR